MRIDTLPDYTRPDESSLLWSDSTLKVNEQRADSLRHKRHAHAIAFSVMAIAAVLFSVGAVVATMFNPFLATIFVGTLLCFTASIIHGYISTNTHVKYKHLEKRISDQFLLKQDIEDRNKAREALRESDDPYFLTAANLLPEAELRAIAQHNFADVDELNYIDPKEFSHSSDQSYAPFAISQHYLSLVGQNVKNFSFNYYYHAVPKRSKYNPKEDVISDDLVRKKHPITLAQIAISLPKLENLKLVDFPGCNHQTLRPLLENAPHLTHLTLDGCILGQKTPVSREDIEDLIVDFPNVTFEIKSKEEMFVSDVMNRSERLYALTCMTFTPDQEVMIANEFDDLETITSTETGFVFGSNNPKDQTLNTKEFPLSKRFLKLIGRNVTDIWLSGIFKQQEHGVRHPIKISDLPGCLPKLENVYLVNFPLPTEDELKELIMRLPNLKKLSLTEEGSFPAYALSKEDIEAIRNSV